MRHTHRALPGLVAAGLSTVLVLAGFAWAAETPDPMAEGDRLFAEQKWEEAAAQYRAASAPQAKDPRAHFRLGRCLHSLGRHAEAIAAYERALAAGFAPAWSAYFLAAANARLGQPEAAEAALGQALEAGYANADTLRTDPDLAALRARPTFAARLAQADRNANPCMHDERYRQLDFWIGEWEVTSGGQPAGRNRIERILGGCALLESWTSTYGGVGTSLNYFDPKDAALGRWRQHWVNGSGGNIAYAGELVDGAMRFEGTSVSHDGSRTRQRMSFTPLADGRVRQLIEQSLDSGKTWTVWFDGMYTRSAD